MKTGKYTGSGLEYAIKTESKKDILEIIKVASEHCLHHPNPALEAKIKEVWEEYKKI